MKEIDIQNQIRIALSEYGDVFRTGNMPYETSDGRIYKSGLPNGFPDLLFVGNGYVAFIEVKKPGGRKSDSQIKFLDRMKSRGHKAGFAYSVEDALKIIMN